VLTYQALFEPAVEGGFVITFPDLPFGVSQADSEEDGVIEAVALLETIIGELIKKGEPFPAAKRRRGQNYRSVVLPSLSSVKAELYREFLASGIRKAELAKHLEISEGHLERLFDFRRGRRLELLEAAFSALGKRLVIEVVPTKPPTGHRNSAAG